jgi:predicted Fe-Mo cluster-binding NifX family protein
MNIAISAAGPTLDSPVFDEFRRTPFLLIVNVDTMECTSIPHAVHEGSETALADTVLEHRCEALITGKIGEEAFKILADDHVTRYVGSGLTAGMALEAMETRGLKLIRNPEGSDECHENHHELEELQVCNGHTH